ncbi:MAG: outer membrane lipoprotein-sorting protein [Candidatus Marinimicrobia bacterium]|jgi:outer membrane lipoprotein-sorting protein|nr:outer membrane lipoprotein-sorting protein [Candidatus Neomarinimicrobiota bacterium]MDP6852684.1 outer membrane lipoprotein-sorting protein [Candidatus Neomarinimicrobiota bacterium]
MKLISVIYLLTFCFALDGTELARLMDIRKTPKDSKADLTMVLTNKKGKQRTSTIRSFSKDGGEKQITWFLAPADDKGVGFLKIEHDSKDDEMRMWLPAFKKVRRISAGKKSDSFMGSDMSYEDMASRQIDEFDFTITGEQDINGVLCKILESKPKESVQSEYSRHLSWVHPEKHITLQEHSFDKSGNLLKEKKYAYTVIKEYDILQEITVTNVLKNHSTRLTFSNMDLDTGIPDSQFHEKYLKRLPK